MKSSLFIPNVLSIAGSDPSGGAGIQADLKTFAALGVYGMAVITSLTAQNTRGVAGVADVPPDFVAKQLQAIFADIKVDAVKIGMLSNAKIIIAVAEMIEKHSPQHVILDPVMVATSGDSLIAGDAVEMMKSRLIPLCDVLTPNIPEAEKLTRKAVLEMDVAALELHQLGAGAIYLKGGHLKGNNASDLLYWDGGAEFFDAPRIDTKNTHGTGCTLSSAIAAFLARGMSLREACASAKAYVTSAIIHADELDVGSGSGHGPLNHMYQRGSEIYGKKNNN